jgi:hypothetical protein
MNKITLGIHTPNPKDATSIYRAWGPWSVHRNEVNLFQLNAGDPNWVDFCCYDAIFVHRPFEQAHLNMVSRAKQLGVPVWLDFDDDLFSLHISNRQHERYDQDSTRNLISLCCKEASLITVSTPALAKVYSQFNKRVEVIANKIPDHLLGRILNRDRATLPRKTILWRGTEHHDVNLRFYERPILETIKDKPEWTWCFFGHKPWAIIEQANPGQVEHRADSDPFGFYNQLFNLNCWVQVVPLVDSAFNRAKSNIAYLEGAGFGGSVVVAPNLPEWNALTGIVNYKAMDHSSFKEALGRVLEMSLKEWHNMAGLARKYVRKNGTVSSLGTARLDLLDSLLVKKDQA